MIKSALVIRGGAPLIICSYSDSVCFCSFSYCSKTMSCFGYIAIIRTSYASSGCPVYPVML
jgi:hypothetical protein